MLEEWSELPASVAQAIASCFELSQWVGEVEHCNSLNSLSNSVFELVSSKGKYVLRLPSSYAQTLVDRHAELNNLTAAASDGLTVQPLYFEPATGVMLSPFVEVSRQTPEPKQLGAVLARLHSLQSGFENNRDLAGWVYRLLEAEKLSRLQRNRVAAAFESLNGAEHWRESRIVPCHWDVTADNCLVTENGVLLIDWEYSAKGPRAWDLAYASLELGYSAEQEADFIAAYAVGSEQQIKISDEVAEMKVACDLVSALWAFGLQADLALNQDLKEFGQTRLERAERHLDALNL